MKIRLLISFLFCQCCVYSQHWQSLSTGINNNPLVLFADSTLDKLFVGGQFTQAGGLHSWGIASWDGTAWDSLASGVDDSSYTSGPNNVLAIAREGSHLYVGGAFQSVGNLPHTHYVARWDGTSWDSLSGGQLDGEVIDIEANNGEIYVCGGFSNVGSLSAHSIAKWDGTSWHAIGSNYFFTPYIAKMAFYHGDLYVGGFFDDPNGNTCRIAKWDGTTWTFMSNVLQGTIADVWDMVVYNDKLYVAGLFFTSDGNVANSIMTWNDTTWSAVGGSIQITTGNIYPTVKDICVHNGKLYCAGNFEKIGGIPAMGLASWDGTQWCGYGDGFFNFSQYSGATNVDFYRDTMYVAGGFNFADTVNVSYIAKWIGGNYVDTCGVITTGMHEQIGMSNAVTLFPNPASNQISFLFGSLDPKEIIITDQLGREVMERALNGEKQIDIPVNNLAEGMYLYTITDQEGRQVGGKLIVNH